MTHGATRTTRPAQLSRRVQYWICSGNLLIAAMVAAAELAIPTRSLWLDAPAALLMAALLASCVAVIMREARAVLVIRVSALLLLAFGLFAITGLSLSVAFLFGVHGHFVRDGVPLTMIGYGLVIPYTLAYPLLVLAHTKPAR